MYRLREEGILIFSLLPLSAEVNILYGSTATPGTKIVSPLPYSS
jgi:hypothetical protein